MGTPPLQSASLTQAPLWVSSSPFLATCRCPWQRGIKHQLPTALECWENCGDTVMASFDQASPFSSAAALARQASKRLYQPCFGSQCLNLSQSSLSQVSVGNLLRSMIEVIGLETSLLNDIIGFNYVIMPLKVWGWKVALIFSSEIPPKWSQGILKQWVFKVLSFSFSRGKPEWACLGTAGWGVIILREAVPGLCLCIGAFVRSRQELP